MEDYWYDSYVDATEKLTELEAEHKHLKEEHNQLVKQVENLPEDIYNKYIAEIE